MDSRLAGVATVWDLDEFARDASGNRHLSYFGTGRPRLIYQGIWIKANILIAWGDMVTSLVDNVLYPLLVATELRFHKLDVLFAAFGGLVACGLAGAVLGPLILAATRGFLRSLDTAAGTIAE